MVRIDFTHGQKCPFCDGTMSKTKEGYYYCRNGCYHEKEEVNKKSRIKVPTEFDFS